MSYQDELAHARFSGGMLLLGDDTALNKNLATMSTDDLKRAKQAEQNKINSLDGDIKVRLTQYEQAKKAQSDLDAKAAAAKTEYENAISASRANQKTSVSTAQRNYDATIVKANGTYNDAVLKAKAAYDAAVAKAAKDRDQIIAVAKKELDRVSAPASSINTTLKKAAMDTAQQKADNNRSKVVQTKADYDNAIREREAYANHIKQIDAELRNRKG